VRANPHAQSSVTPFMLTSKNTKNGWDWVGKAFCIAAGEKEACNLACRDLNN